MSFTAIESQEELDRIIGERLTREREAAAKRYEGFLSPEDAAKKYEGYTSPTDLDKVKADYDSKIAALNTSIEEANGKIQTGTESLAAKEKEISDLGAKIKSYEAAALRSKIAQETGLPYGMAERLRGEKEEDIRKDAQALSELIGKRNVAPTGSPEPVETDKSGKRAAYHNMIANMGKQ